MGHRGFTPLENSPIDLRKRRWRFLPLTGFTLIELIVVIAIIAILASIVTPSAFRAIEKAKITKAISDFKSIKTAAYALYADTGQWVISPPPGDHPIYTTDLASDVHNWQGWDGPYIENGSYMTPWRGQYCVEVYNLGKGSQLELYVEFENTCYPSGPNMGCNIPQQSAIKIDSALDDGDLCNGEIRYQICGSQDDLSWVLSWDVF